MLLASLLATLHNFLLVGGEFGEHLFELPLILLLLVVGSGLLAHSMIMKEGNIFMKGV